MTAVAYTVLGCTLLASLGYIAWEYRRAVVRDDWTSSGDEKLAAAWDQHCATVPGLDGLPDLRTLSVNEAAAVLGMRPFFAEWSALVEAESA